MEANCIKINNKKSAINMNNFHSPQKRKKCKDNKILFMNVRLYNKLKTVLTSGEVCEISRG